MRKQRRGQFPALSAEDRQPLERLAAAHTTPARLKLRSRIVLLSADGLGLQPVADALGVSPLTVRKWRARYLEDNLDGLRHDRPRPGRPSPISDELYLAIQTFPQREAPPHPLTHWTVRAAAARLGVSASTVHRVWRRHQVRPHGRDSFKVSEDPEFDPKVRALVPLLQQQPEGAAVLSFDEKPSIPARDRTQPGLPLYPGRKGTMTHDYRRHGYVHLQTCLDLRTGRVIARTMRRNRSEDFIRGMNGVLRQLPRSQRVHVILDNSPAHTSKRTRAWLRRHPRVTFHYTPISCSWLNPVEGFFSILTRRCLRDGVFRSRDELIQALQAYAALHNREYAKPYQWRGRSAEDLIAQHDRLLVVLNTARAEATC